MTADHTKSTILHPADLSLMERTYLGVLDTGITPARLAGDLSLRMDSVTAVCLALREGKPAGTYLEGDGPQPDEPFLDQLNAAVRSLDERGVIAAVPPPPDVVLSLETARPPLPARLDFDQHPKIWDRYLAHECMDELFNDGRVYPFLMGKYQDSGEVWARLYKQTPERFL